MPTIGGLLMHDRIKTTTAVKDQQIRQTSIITNSNVANNKAHEEWTLGCLLLTEGCLRRYTESRELHDGKQIQVGCSTSAARTGFIYASMMHVNLRQQFKGVVRSTTTQGQDCSRCQQRTRVRVSYQDVTRTDQRYNRNGALFIEQNLFGIRPPTSTATGLDWRSTDKHS